MSCCFADRDGEAQRGRVTHSRPLSLGVADPNPGLSGSEAHAGVTEPGKGDEGLSLKGSFGTGDAEAPGFLC